MHNLKFNQIYFYSIFNNLNHHKFFYVHLTFSTLIDIGTRGGTIRLIYIFKIHFILTDKLITKSIKINAMHLIKAFRLSHARVSLLNTYPSSHCNKVDLIKISHNSYLAIY